MTLWENPDPNQWAMLADQFLILLGSSSKERLLELEMWYQEELPKSLESKDMVDKQQLIKIVDWKLTRGKWRPRLLDFAKNADEQQVIDASSRAFTTLRNSVDIIEENQLKEALNHLIELKGVGPATATAILSAKNSSIPFMSDEALLAVFSKKEYTLNYAIKLTAALQKKAKELNDSDTTRQWNARMVERCLFIDKRAAGDALKSEKKMKRTKKNDNTDVDDVGGKPMSKRKK